MGVRRQARELALQALFYFDMNMEDAPHELLTLFCESFEEMIEKDSKSFFIHLVQGVMALYEQIDALLNQASKNWRVARMPVVDRNIMRVAVFELLKCDDIPERVSINEAVDIGKKYGSRDSGAFINAVLDKIRIYLQTINDEQLEMILQSRNLGDVNDYKET